MNKRVFLVAASCVSLLGSFGALSAAHATDTNPHCAGSVGVNVWVRGVTGSTPCQADFYSSPSSDPVHADCNDYVGVSDGGDTNLGVGTNGPGSLDPNADDFLLGGCTISNP